MYAKQMVMTQFGEDLVPQQGAVRFEQPGEVLVKIVEAGVCHFDVHSWQGKDQSTLLPVVPGHEAIGLVMDVKGEKKDAEGDVLAQGDLIVWQRDVACGECHFCRILHQPEHCPWALRYGATRNGSYADFQVLDAKTEVLKVDGGSDLEMMTLITCAGAMVGYAVEWRPPKPDETVLVVGSGSLGMLAVAFAKSLGVKMIMVVGSTERRLQACQQLGATHVMNRMFLSLEERLRLVRDCTEGRGADWVLEAGGTGEALREAMDAARAGGVCFTAGLGSADAVFTLNPSIDLVQKGLTLKGLWQGRMSHMTRARQVIRESAETFQGLVTHRFKMDRATEALRAMSQPDVVKAVLIP